MAIQFKAKVTDSFWFVPLVMGVFGVFLAQVLIGVDYWMQQNQIIIPSAQMGVEGGRSILTALAGSVLGVAATAFSITMSVLATASTAYGPRLVRNFMADNRNQFVLGSFATTFLYALMVLRSVRDSSDVGPLFVPDVSIIVAILFGVMNVGLLIYFIHHISDSVQISTLISRVRDDLIRAIESLYPVENENENEEVAEHDDVPLRFANALPQIRPNNVRTNSDGFVTWIDYESLTKHAKKNDALIKLLVQPGDYVHKDMIIAHAWQRSESEERHITWPLDDVHIGQTRTPYQDLRYAVQQPVDITIRALSSGTNDPYTAINAIRGLGSGMTRLVQRVNADSVMLDVDGEARLHKRTITIEHMIESIFRTLRANITGSVDATMAVLELAQNMIDATERESYINVIVHGVEVIRDTYIDSDAPAADKEIVENAASLLIRDNRSVAAEKAT